MLTILRRLSFLIMAVTSAALGQSLQTDHVLIVNIDGLRCQDGLESGNLTMPFLWDSLRPFGTLYTSFQNRGITVTNAGHSTIVTGVRQVLPNNAGIATPLRPQEPTLAEYYRKERGVPQEQVYFISGKTSIWKYPVSLFPGYGYPYAATVTLTSSQDTVTWDSTRAILQRDHPSLAYVLFAQVDAEGHTADSLRYFGAIRRVDSLVYTLWQFLQADSVYRDRTTMIVISDHGRHDDLHGGWQGHGDFCHGCRHVMCFAIGPDITPGLVTGIARDQIDIAPTVAYLLGFHAPLARGAVMREMFRNPPPAPTAVQGPTVSGRSLSETTVLPHSPSIAVNARGIHVVYSGGNPGSGAILYTRSIDAGTTWSPPVEIFAQAGTDYLEPAIASFADGCLYTAVTATRDFVADTSNGWILEGRRSTDSGFSWGPVGILDTLTTISTAPSIAASGTRVNIVAMMGYRVWNYTSTDGGVTFVAKQIHAANSTTPTCTLLDTMPYVAWRHLNKDSLPYWNVLYDRKPWRPGDHPVTSNDVTTYSYLPSLEADGDSLVHLVYQHLTNAPTGNEWRIHHRRKGGLDAEWGTAEEVAPGRTAWSPAVRGSPSGDLHTVWADREGEEWSIRSSISTDHGLTWEPSIQRSSPQALALHPSLAMCGDTAYVAWEDWQSGVPQVLFTRYAVYQNLPVPYEPGWNLFSLPVNPPDRSVGALFHCPTFCYVFAYDSGLYRQVDTLFPGRGYWTKVPTAGSPGVRGRLLAGDTVSLQAGWNLIGGMSDTVAAANLVCIPAGNVHWPAFLYNSTGYHPTSEIVPGKGHWIKANAPGLLIFPVMDERALHFSP
jgi:hypothetical protein